MYIEILFIYTIMSKFNTKNTDSRTSLRLGGKQVSRKNKAWLTDIVIRNPFGTASSPRVNSGTGVTSPMAVGSSTTNKRAHKGETRKACPRKRALKLGVWNITSLGDKALELFDILKAHNLGILALTSVRRAGSGYTDFPLGRLYHSGHCEGLRSKAGVGIMIARHFIGSIASWHAVDKHICYLRIRIEGKIFCIVVVYGPVNSHAMYETFIRTLSNTVAALPKYDHLIILGDFNAHTGNDSVKWKGICGPYGDSSVNRSGELLLSFCASHNLRVANGFFSHKAVHKYTWENSARGQRSILDLVMIDQASRSLIMDVRVRRGAVAYTDHYLVVARMEVPCKKRAFVRKSSAAVDRIDHARLCDPGVSSAYNALIAEKFVTLPESCSAVETEWLSLKSKLISAAKISCGVKSVRAGRFRREHAYWFTKEVRDAVKAKKEAFRSWTTNTLCICGQESRSFSYGAEGETRAVEQVCKKAG